MTFFLCYTPKDVPCQRDVESWLLMLSVLAEFLFDKQLAFVVRISVDTMTWLERAIELSLIILSTLQHARIAEFRLKSSVKLVSW